MTTTTQQAPPDHLGTRGRSFWTTVLSQYDIAGADLNLLQSACELLDRSHSARLLIETEGLTVQDRFGQAKSHPAVDIERSSLLGFVRIARELGLHVEVPESRPAHYPRGYK